MTEQEQKAFDQMREALESVQWHGGGSCWVVDDDKIEAALTAANAMSHPQATEPAGWKLVPVEPTPEMREAGLNQLDTLNADPTRLLADRAYFIYRAMLAAAPEAKQ